MQLTLTLTFHGVRLARRCGRSCEASESGSVIQWGSFGAVSWNVSEMRCVSSQVVNENASEMQCVSSRVVNENAMGSHRVSASVAEGSGSLFLDEGEGNGQLDGVNSRLLFFEEVKGSAERHHDRGYGEEGFPSFLGAMENACEGRKSVGGDPEVICPYHDGYQRMILTLSVHGSLEEGLEEESVHGGMVGLDCLNARNAVVAGSGIVRARASDHDHEHGRGHDGDSRFAYWTCQEPLSLQVVGEVA